MITTTRTDHDTGDPFSFHNLADELFTSKMHYDCLNRAIVSQIQGPSANGTDDLYTLVGYDSRGNRTLSIDPKGNTSVVISDGAMRD